MNRLRIPIRVKFMLAFLILATAVVGLITFSTANSFQEDKKAYINGLTSMVALGMAEEARSTLAGYSERLRLYARVILDETESHDDREGFTQKLFDEFPELVSVVVRTEGEDPATAYNLSLLEQIGLTRDELQQHAVDHPVSPEQLAAGAMFVRNLSISGNKPCFTMDFELQDEAGDKPGSNVSGVLLSERLQQLVSRFSAYEQFLTDSEGGLLAHSSRREDTRGSWASLPAEASAVQDQFNASITVEYSQDETDLIGSFASVDLGGVIAGAQIPRSAAHLASRLVVNRLLTIAVVLLVVAIVAGFVFAHQITRPMERLSDATRAIADGEFDIDIRIESRDEMGDLSGSFNHMASELKSREEQLIEAHGQVVHSEKMAAFGQLGAGIAHEVKNPLAGILSCAQLAVDDVEPGSRLHEDLELIEKETRRCKEIIDNLLKFARQEPTEMTVVELTEVLESSVAIVNHQLELNEVQVENRVPQDLPHVFGNANQLQQVFVNLLINAQQAMEGSPGSICISSELSGDGMLELRFADTGPGIPKEVRDKLFEPFFTTKEAGKGTGLGLSVSFGIIKDHRGEIGVLSEIGQGTVFVISLPVLVEQATVGTDAEMPELSPA